MEGALRRTATSMLTSTQATPAPPQMRHVTFSAPSRKDALAGFLSRVPAPSNTPPALGGDVTFPAVWPLPSSNAEGVKFIQRACERLGCGGNGRRAGGEGDQRLKGKEGRRVVVLSCGTNRGVGGG